MIFLFQVKHGLLFPLVLPFLSIFVEPLNSIVYLLLLCECWVFVSRFHRVLLVDEDVIGVFALNVLVFVSLTVLRVILVSHC